MDKTPEHLRRLAHDHLKFEAGVETLVRRKGRVADPIPVEHPRGSVTHWFVPVAVDGRLAGYFLFDTQLVLQRYSSFLHRSDSVEGAPDLGSWTELPRVVRTAAKSAPGLKVGDPYLTYDGVPSRLAWAVPIQSKGGAPVLYVAGDHVYTKPLGADSTG